MNMSSTPPPTAYYPHPRYGLMAALCAILAVVLVGNLLQRFTPATAFFGAAALGVAIWSAQAALSRVTVTEQGLRVQAPLGATQPITFGQLVSVSMDGRFTAALTVIYHPQRPDGLLDLDEIRAVHLPTLLDQEELLDYLQARLPL